MSASASSSKAILYSFPASIWSRAARFAAYDLGYVPDVVEVRDVNLDIGEEYTLWYLSLNPNGTVPTLVVPPGSVLNPEGEKEVVLTDSKHIISLLCQHARSRHSSLPSSAAQPSTSSQIIDLLRSASSVDPRMLARSPRDEDEFRKLAPQLGTIHIYRQDQLESTLRELEELSSTHDADDAGALDGQVDGVPHGLRKNKEEVAKLKAWVEAKAIQNQKLVSQWTDPDPSSPSREALFAQSRVLWGTTLPSTLRKLEELIVGPFCNGEPSEGGALDPADYTLASYVERCLQASGGVHRPCGLFDLEQKVGGTFRVGPKLRGWWERIGEREAFVRVFGGKGAVEGGLDEFERRVREMEGVQGWGGIEPR